MSKENVVDHLCNKQINFIGEDELLNSCKKSLIDISHSSENLNSTDKFNLSNTQGKNNLKTSTMSSTDDSSNKQLIGTDIVQGSSQLNQSECKFIIEKINSNETDLNSQEENLLFELVKKNNAHIFNTNTDILDLNTQQFMDYHLCKTVQQLNEFSPTLTLDSSETHTIKQIDSENSTVIPPLPLIKEVNNLEINNKNSIIVNDFKKLEKFNYPSPKIDHKLSTRDYYVEYPGEDQDAEIIEFRAMCEAMLKIGTIDNNKIDDNKIIVKKNNQLNKIVIKQVNHINVISCLNSTEDKPSTSKLNSAANSNFFKGANDNSKRLAHKRHQINDLRFDSSDDSSPEYSNELPSKQYNYKCKKTKMTFLQNNLKINSKCYSDTIVIQPENVNRIKLSDLQFEDKEVDCMLVKNPLPKVQNVINDLKCKKINDDSLEQNKLPKENQTIYYYSPAGKVHNDMLNYIKKKNCHSVK